MGIILAVFGALQIVFDSQMDVHSAQRPKMLVSLVCVDVQPILKNLVMPLSNCDGSEVVLFLDETSHNLRFISGPFPLSGVIFS